MTHYVENPDATRKPLELISKFEEYKINTQKSVALLYTNNKGSEREIKEKKNPHYHHIKKNKIPRNKLEEAKDS